MFDEQDQQQYTRLGRRAFVGGLASLAVASSVSLAVADDTAAQVTNGDSTATQTLSSPDGAVELTVDVTNGVPSYSVVHDGMTVITDSTLGFEFQDQAPFHDGIVVTGTERSATHTTWTPIWDQYDEIREQYAALRIGLQEATDPNRSLTLELRAFDDGVGFRYVFPENSGFGEFVISSERTEFAFDGDYTSWWIQNDFNSYEYAYSETSLSEISSQSPTGGVHTPLTMKAAEDRYLSIHEASLVDYAAMAIEPQSEGPVTFESTLAPLPDGTKVTAAAPHQTPWRTIQIGRRPGALVESNLILNLNAPHDPTDFPQGTDWIEPQKFLGVWWLMITGRADWEYMGPETGNHGAQTGRMKRYMDFASEHGIPSVLVEGWNKGWSTYPGDGSAMDFDASYPDFDWEAITEYGQQLNPSVEMTAHNETAGNISNYEAQLNDDPNPFAEYEERGIHSIKTGYVADSGVTIDGTTYNHHCQPLVNHHRLVYRAAAKHRQMLEIHEPIKPTGERRTYPNVMTREGVLGQEYDSFGYVSPAHHVTFPFTRMLGGPVEYTPGIFDADSGSGGIEATRAKQLAMYPTYFSGLQMIADLPESYLAAQPAVLTLGGVAQAEFGELDGFPTAAKWANAQGGQYVPVDPNRSSNATASWTVEGVAAGEYEFHLRYASDEENNAVPPETPRTATVMVNGSPSTQLDVPPTAYWDEWETMSTTIPLTAGENTVAVAVTDEDTGGFNLDAVALTDTGQSMPEPDTDPTLGPTVPAFQFIKDVPAAGWDDTRVLDAAIGEYMITARQKEDEWYVGAMTDEDGRALDIPLDFLDAAPGRRKGHEKHNSNGHGKSRGNGHTRGKYVAEIYSDGIDAEYDTNLSDVRTDEAIVTPRTTILASMIETGGTAIRLRPATGREIVELPTYERPTQTVDVSIETETFVKEPFIVAAGSNSGDYIGGTTVELVVDSEVVANANIRFAPNSTDQTPLSYSIDTPGDHDVTVQTADGTALATETVTVKPPVTVASLSDSADDDHGPGRYTYPTNSAFEDGAFDLRSFTVEQTPSVYEFTFEVENLYNAFGSSRGFSPQMFVLWVHDPNKDGGSTTSLDDLLATTSFEQPWHYRMEISGFTKSLVDSTGAPVTDAGNQIALREAVATSSNTVTVSVDRAAFDDVDVADLEVVPVVQSEDRGTLRPVAETNESYVFGGATAGAKEMAPRIMDTITPEGITQHDALSYTAEQRASLPFVSLR